MRVGIEAEKNLSYICLVVKLYKIQDLQYNVFALKTLKNYIWQILGKSMVLNAKYIESKFTKFVIIVQYIVFDIIAMLSVFY